MTRTLMSISSHVQKLALRMILQKRYFLQIMLAFSKPKTFMKLAEI